MPRRRGRTQSSISALWSALLLKDLAVSRLGKAKVHHLVHQLVHRHKVVADALLLQFLEVLLENLAHTEAEAALGRRRCMPSAGWTWEAKMSNVQVKWRKDWSYLPSGFKSTELMNTFSQRDITTKKKVKFGHLYLDNLIEEGVHQSGVGVLLGHGHHWWRNC